MNNPFREEQTIFNGKFKLITIDNEYRMSHWVKGFGILDAITGNEVLAFEGSFNLEEFKEKATTLFVRFKVYPNGSDQYEVEIDPFAGTFTYKNETLKLQDFASMFQVLNK